MASAGGVINYATKPALTIRAMDVATDHRGTSYGAIDFGQLFGKTAGSGVRLNFAGEICIRMWRAQTAGALWARRAAMEARFGHNAEGRFRVPASRTALRGGISTAGWDDGAGAHVAGCDAGRSAVVEAGIRSMFSTRARGSIGHSVRTGMCIWPAHTATR